MENNTNKDLAGVCGICCSCCSLYIGSNEDSDRIRIIAERMNISVNDLKCEGCRSETISVFCKTCHFKTCSKKKEIDFCFECTEYPCKELFLFQKEKPHRIELWNQNEFLKTNGLEKWFSEISALHSCSNCRTINSAYDLQCRKCETYPSSDFVALYGDQILNHMKNNTSTTKIS
jgi:hypothetical protein